MYPDRKVDLISYLPEFLRQYKELKKIYEIENETIDELWKEHIRAFRNGFINHADEIGIELFEKMIGITPNPEDTLEIRRNKIYTKWNIQPPYTFRFLINFLSGILEKFEVKRDLNIQELRIITVINKAGIITNLYNDLRKLIPANMTLIFENNLNNNSISKDFYLGTVITTLIYQGGKNGSV